jgi:iron complex transport system ATP-binding protein
MLNAAGGNGDRARTLSLDHVCASPWGKPLLENITLELEAGTILALAGPNGAGKSSLLQLISGDIQTESGRLLLGDRAIADWPAQERAQRLAFLPQMSLLNFPYTVEEVVMLGRTPHSSGLHRDREVVKRALRLTDTLPLRQRLYTQLSGGEKQRTQLARVLAQILDGERLSGRLLLLDEPTSALDLAHQQQILLAVRELARCGCAVILVIHDLNLAASIADRVLVLDNGRQVAMGTPHSVLTADLFRDVFAVEVDISRHPRGDYPMITLLHRLAQ